MTYNNYSVMKRASKTIRVNKTAMWEITLLWFIIPLKQSKITTPTKRGSRAVIEGVADEMYPHTRMRIRTIEFKIEALSALILIIFLSKYTKWF